MSLNEIRAIWPTRFPTECYCSVVRVSVANKTSTNGEKKYFEKLLKIISPDQSNWYSGILLNLFIQSQYNVIASQTR